MGARGSGSSLVRCWRLHGAPRVHLPEATGNLRRRLGQAKRFAADGLVRDQSVQFVRGVRPPGDAARGHDRKRNPGEAAQEVSRIVGSHVRGLRSARRREHGAPRSERCDQRDDRCRACAAERVKYRCESDPGSHDDLRSAECRTGVPAVHVAWPFSMLASVRRAGRFAHCTNALIDGGADRRDLAESRRRTADAPRHEAGVCWRRDLR